MIMEFGNHIYYVLTGFHRFIVMMYTNASLHIETSVYKMYVQSKSSSSLFKFVLFPHFPFQNHTIVTK